MNNCLFFGVIWAMAVLAINASPLLESSESNSEMSKRSSENFGQLDDFSGEAKRGGWRGFSDEDKRSVWEHGDVDFSGEAKRGGWRGDDKRNAWDDFSGEAKRGGWRGDDKRNAWGDFSGEAKRGGWRGDDKRNAWGDFSGEAKRGGWRGDDKRNAWDDFSGEAKRGGWRGLDDEAYQHLDKRSGWRGAEDEGMQKRLTAMALLDSLRAYNKDQANPHHRHE